MIIPIVPFAGLSEERQINFWLSSDTAPLPNDEAFDKYLSMCKDVAKRKFPNGSAELPFAVNCYIGRIDTSSEIAP